MPRKGVNYYELDYVTIYNFMKTNDLKYAELSQMLGKEAGYISGVLTKNRRVPEDVLDKICDLMGKTREEVIAHKDSVFNTTLEVKPDVNVEENEPEAEVRPPFEERMKQMLRDDEDRRKRFVMSDAYRSEVEKGNDLMSSILDKKTDVYKEKWDKVVDCVCTALKDGKKSVDLISLVQLMVG